MLDCPQGCRDLGCESIGKTVCSLCEPEGSGEGVIR